MMDYESLIADLQKISQMNSISHYKRDVCAAAAIALSTRQAENEEMQKQLNEFSEFLCHMTGGLLSKTNYTAQEMISAAANRDECFGTEELFGSLAWFSAAETAKEIVQQLMELPEAGGEDYERT